MMKTPNILHLGVFLENYSHYNFKVLNRKLQFFHIFSIYYVQSCLGNFKKPKIVYINVEEDPEIRFLENIAQFKFSYTILIINFEKSVKLREILKIRVFLKVVLIEVYHIQRISGFTYVITKLSILKKLFF